MTDRHRPEQLHGLAHWNDGLGPWLAAFLVIRQTRQAGDDSVFGDRSLENGGRAASAAASMPGIE